MWPVLHRGGGGETSSSLPAAKFLLFYTQHYRLFSPLFFYHSGCSNIPCVAFFLAPWSSPLVRASWRPPARVALPVWRSPSAHPPTTRTTRRSSSRSCRRRAHQTRCRRSLRRPSRAPRRRRRSFRRRRAALEVASRRRAARRSAVSTFSTSAAVPAPAVGAARARAPWRSTRRGG